MIELAIASRKLKKRHDAGAVVRASAIMRE
jgi:hypothetical protein